jgi:putative SOS response-associated peptidase YedK
MCGRYTVRRFDSIRAGLRAAPGPGFEEFDERPRFNITPAQMLPIVKADDKGKPILTLAKWGYVPFWTKGKPKLAPINAKSENVATSPMFRLAFKDHRCIVPADGFYEWKGAKPPKQPYFAHLKDDSPFAFAGLWSRWKPEVGEPVDTFTILTTEPNELLEKIHNRMPVIIRQRDYVKWLTGDAAATLLQSYDAKAMEAYPVSTKVNRPGNDGPDLIKPEK